MEASSDTEFDYLFKVLLIGDSGVGKSSILLSFTNNTFDHLNPTIGVDFKVKYIQRGGKKIKLAIWDTVYDVTRRDTFTNLSEVWSKEIDLYSTNQDCIRMLVGNKVDKESERVVTKKEGRDFAKEHGSLFIECSAKTRDNVEECFEELVLKILDTPGLIEDSSKATKKNILKGNRLQNDSATSSCC
ncbi:hypothetical protein AgCh_009314 [Apium graveolens]